MIDGKKKGQPVVVGASITRTASVSRSSSGIPQHGGFAWREKQDSDDEKWQLLATSPEQKRNRRRSKRLILTSNRHIKSPEVVDMCNSDSDIEEVGAPEEPTVSWLVCVCLAI